ncbi:MAG: hypothetical protein KJ069_16890 [Anaerolineae bacterium]|nr:hypothetical protein [Anaerolineae bacterium]
MMSWQLYQGYYCLMEKVLEVKTRGEELVATLPGVPPGFEVVLCPLAAHTFQMHGGPADGATAVFQTNDAGQVTAVLVGGAYELTRLDGPPPASAYPTGQGLLAPQWTLDGAKQAAFSALLAEIVGVGGGRLLEYQLPYPKHEFLQYVAAQEVVIFHGSGEPDIDEFLTRRTSMELNDKSGRGNVQGIYGTHDALWPLFFAVVDRPRITGSIRNGFSTFRNGQGEELRVYDFSINHEWLDKEPWRTGTLYFLPRDTFRRMPLTAAGGLSNEWVSEVPLRPLARLHIEPEDFPFLHQIGGHDDSELLQLATWQDEVVTAVTDATFSPETIHMKLAYTSERGSHLLEYISLSQKYLPAATFTLRFQPGGEVWYDFSGPPAAMQVMKDRLAEKVGPLESNA